MDGNFNNQGNGFSNGQNGAANQQGSYQNNSYQQGGYQNNGYYGGQPQGGPVYGQPFIPEEYKPISMWGYFGYEILFSIPIVGLVMLIIFSITATNKNLKNFARSYFCFMIIAFIIAMIVVASGVVGALASGGF